MIWKKQMSNLLEKADLRVPPVIITVNDFDEKSVNKFKSEINQAINSGQKLVPIVIDSYGGYVYSLMSMISMIKACPLPVATIIQGKAMSCGAILATFGDDGMRYCDPYATIMIHEVASGSFGKVEELKASVEQTDILNDKVLVMMSRNCNQPDDYFKKLIHEKGHADWYLDPKEALKHQIVNHLKIPTLNLKIDVTIDLE